MEIVCDQLFRALEYERMLSEEGISGQRHLSYVLEQPERREQKMKRVYEIRDCVAEGDIRDYDKETLLSKINRELKMLKTGKYMKEHGDCDEIVDADVIENGIYLKPILTHLLTFSLGVGSGYVLKQVKDENEKNREEKFKQQVSEAVESVYKELRQSRNLVGEITSEMKQTKEATQRFEKTILRIYEKLDEKEKKRKSKEADECG